MKFGTDIYGLRNMNSNDCGLTVVPDEKFRTLVYDLRD